MEKTLADILETVAFIKDNAATKEDLASTKKELREEMSSMKMELRQEIKDSAESTKSELRKEIRDSAEWTKRELREEMTKYATKKDSTELKSEILTHIDDFASMVKHFQTELAAMQAKYERLERQLQQVAHHLQLTLQ